MLIVLWNNFEFANLNYLFVEEQNHRYGSQPAIVPDGAEKI